MIQTPLQSVIAGMGGDFKVSRRNYSVLAHSITEFAKQDKPAFLKFVEQNVDSNLLVVYRLLAWIGSSCFRKPQAF